MHRDYFKLPLPAGLKESMLRAVFLWTLVMCVGAQASTPLQDPTRPVAHSSAAGMSEAPVQLQAIFLRESGNQAVVNGRLMQVGDRIANMRVLSIARNTVRFMDGEDVRELSLRPSILSMPELED